MQTFIVLYLTELLQRTSVIQKVQHENEEMGEVNSNHYYAQRERERERERERDMLIGFLL